MQQAVISRKRNQNFPPVLMNGDELDTSASFTEFGLSLSSNLTWKAHIYSVAKHASQKVNFLARAYRFFSSSHLLYKSQICPSLRVMLQHLGWCSKIYSVCSTKSSPKPFLSSIILTLPNRSSLFPIIV